MLLDIGLGLFSAIALSAWQHTEVTVMYLLAGVGFALFPDLDAFWNAKKLRTRHAHEHRRALHHPLVVVPIGAVVLWFLNPSVAMLFAAATLLHYLHDSVGLGWGIQWLYPFGEHHYGLLYQWDLAQNGHPRRAIYSWTPAEVEQCADRFGSDDWIAKIYGAFHPYAIMEFAVFSIACLIAVWMILGR